MYDYSTKVSAIHRLRVNIKSLAAEARIIRAEEARAGIRYQFELTNHRRVALREESRIAQLAYAFVRGRSFTSTEGTTKKSFSLSRLHQKLIRFGIGVSLNDVVAWYEIHYRQLQRQSA